MAVLNDWQKITRVLPGQPFGNGADGACTSTTIPSTIYHYASGSASSTSLTINSADFTNGDVVIIHQSRGTGVGQWEINRVASGGGTTTLTMEKALQYTYTSSGSSQAQIIKILMYSSINVASGTWTVPSWTTGAYGIFPIACNGNASFSCSVVGTGAGYVGGASFENGHDTAYQGEGTVGASTKSVNANGNGGGGAYTGVGSGGGKGGGGGNGSAGGNGAASGGGTGGTGGGTSGAADLTTMTLGGAGGGGAIDNAGPAGDGGNGGGIGMFFMKNFTNPGNFTFNGNAGQTVGGGENGGNGAGGSILLVCQTATVGSFIASPGTNVSGGTGGNGRIAVHHSGAVTGTFTPSYTDVTDGSLIESLGGSFLFNFV